MLGRAQSSRTISSRADWLEERDALLTSVVPLAMTGGDRWAGPFEQARPQLRAVAYRMLGSLADADDAVQEAWLRLGGADTPRIENVDAWLTTVVARICLNTLRARQARPDEELVAVLPDPIVDPVGEFDPEH